MREETRSEPQRGSAASPASPSALREFVDRYEVLIKATALALLALLAGLAITAEYGMGGYTEVKEFMIPMRDGVRLHTTVAMPGFQGPYPVVLTRGYRPGNQTDADGFVASGYVYVGQSTRGHERSEGAAGVRRRFLDDAQDGYDTLTWIAQQPWCNGQIAMYGKSYWGATQWLVAVEQHPNLKAIIPQVIGADLWAHAYWSNGALTLAMTASGRAHERTDWDRIDRIDWQQYYRHLPLLSLPEQVGAEDRDSAALWRDYVSHSTFDDYWAPITLRADGGDGKYQKIRIPVYLMGGWYDYYPGAAFTSFQRLREVNATSEIRIIINPSDHLNRVVGDREFGPSAGKDEVALATRWLDHVLGRNDTDTNPVNADTTSEIQTEPPIQIFVMGINQWRGEHEWPLARTRFTKYYFHSDDASRNGLLTTEPPLDEPPTEYVYDPETPVPTLGGNYSFIDANIPDLIRVGAVDQRPNESRDDVLIFTTPPLTEDLEVTGPVEIELHAASSAPDTDFTAKLIDVYPDGTAYNLTEGIIRARFRESLWDPPKNLVPGETYVYRLQLLPTANVFMEGHRIRVHLTSSNFPLWDRNPNTGHEQGQDAELRVARQTVFHDALRPSHIVLPIIPRR